MGLTNNKADVAYVKFKEGLFYSSKEKETGYDTLEGYINAFNIVDEEYQGNPSRKLIVKMTDEDGDKYVLKVNFESSYVTGLISFLKNANLSEKLSLVGKVQPTEDGKTKSSILVSQNGTFLKAFYSKTTPNGLPQMKQVTVNKKKVWDKSEMIEFLEDVVLNDLNTQVTTSTPVKTKVEAFASTGDTEDDVDDNGDLPF